MRRRRFLTVCGLGGACASAGCLSIPRLGRGAFDIGMSLNAFEPGGFTTEIGETVVWRNDGSRGHTVTAYENGLPAGGQFFASGDYPDEQSAREAWKGDEGGTIHPGERYRHTFDVAGTYRYFCIPHEPAGMIGEIDVEG